MKLPTLNQISSFSETAHQVLNIVLPVATLLLVNFQLTPIAIIAVLLSKWRVFSVNSSFWFVNLRAAALDIIVGVSSVLLMSEALRGSSEGTPSQLAIITALAITAQYIVWLSYVKPKTTSNARLTQTLWATVLGTWVLTLFSQDISTTASVLYFWLIGLATARHFLSSREERFVDGLSFIWGLIIAQIGWILSQWVHVFEVGNILQVPQSTIIITALTVIAMKSYEEYISENRSLRNITWTASVVLLVLVTALITTDWSGING